MSWTTLASVLAVLVLAAAVALGTRKQTRSTETPRKRYPLTKHESAMFNRLTQALPDTVVLAQVSFGSLLTATSKGARNRFDRKIADFVICNRAHQVLAIIELDDSTHKGQEARDAARDKLLIDAGYRVVRYARIPDIERVRADFLEASLPPMRAEK